MKAQIKVDGKIISELSEKIPTYLIAINELLKNAYDAGAKVVTIKLNTREKTLQIIDNGSGMNKKDIDTLFIISKSNKMYGRKNEYGRIIQGSKGLGFLSVFKFGKLVEWRTNRNKGISFTVDFDQLISMDDISHFPIDLIEDNSIPKGTEIIIKMNTYSVRSLNEYFSLEKNYRKIINSFDDTNFIINLEINNKSCSKNNKIPLLDNEKNQQLFYVTYNSKKQEITFMHNNHMIFTEPYSFIYDQFSLDIELLIFQLKSHGKEKIDKLFFNPNDDLTPLVYFNNNLFYNYTIFDPSVMRSIKTSQVLNQMIGFIRIISKNKKIDFNSDRSQFLQNELTDSIKDFLSNINKKIQEIGSGMKEYLVKFDFLTKNEISSDYSVSHDPNEYQELIKDDFVFKKKVKIAVYDNKVTYSLFGKTATVLINDNTLPSNVENDDQKKNLQPVKFNLYCKDEQEIYIPSEQIDLKDYIDSVYNSKGELIDKKDILIIVNDKKNDNGILPSVKNSCEKNIEYQYFDLETDVAIKKIKLIFKERNVVKMKQRTKSLLITLPVKENYTVNYSDVLNRLIEQINNLPIDKNLEIISCSLRAIFEISVTAIYKSVKYNNTIQRKTNLEDGVVDIIEYVTRNQSNITQIDNASIIGYKNLKNILDGDEFGKIIKKAHLGAHHASTFITEPEIKYIAKYASLFIVITNEMLNNKDVQ